MYFGKQLEVVDDQDDCGCILCSLKVLPFLIVSHEMIDQELLNRGPVISSSFVRHALLSQHHVQLYEMGDAIEAFVSL